MSLPTHIQPLLEAARIARKHAYVPYSRYPVGASILAADGQLYVGCNVENAAYPQSQCAEATAIGNMVSHGQLRIKTILVVIDAATFAAPCGGCRQRISEFADEDTEVYLCNLVGDYQHYRFSDLLPHRFSAKNLA